MATEGKGDIKFVSVHVVHSCFMFNFSLREKGLVQRLPVDWGKPERVPHSHDLRMSHCLSVSLSGGRLAYDRISKWKMLHRALAGSPSIALRSMNFELHNEQKMS